MNKTVIIIAAFLCAAAFMVFRLTTQASPEVHGLDEITYDMQCTDCNATSVYTTKELKQFVKSGKIVEVEYQVRRFPCPKCGKIAAVSYPGNPEANHEKRR